MVRFCSLGRTSGPRSPRSRAGSRASSRRWRPHPLAPRFWTLPLSDIVHILFCTFSPTRNYNRLFYLRRGGPTPRRSARGCDGLGTSTTRFHIPHKALHTPTATSATHDRPIVNSSSTNRTHARSQNRCGPWCGRPESCASLGAVERVLFEAERTSAVGGPVFSAHTSTSSSW